MQIYRDRRNTYKSAPMNYFLEKYREEFKYNLSKKRIQLKDNTYVI